MLISVFNALRHYLSLTGEIYASALATTPTTELKAPVITWPPSF